MRGERLHAVLGFGNHGRAVGARDCVLAVAVGVAETVDLAGDPGVFETFVDADPAFDVYCQHAID